jgi:BirA family transcriptional regulator, biotin operon repressor / biotin---[acetyl-CoA-carboxylase] ligase
MSINARLDTIRLLSDGCWHSGEQLAQTLNVSRAAVWKRLQGLDEWGLELQAVRGRGYRLARPIELLNEELIRGHCPPEVRTRLARIDLFPVLDSTNAWLMMQPEDAGLQICLAEYQTAGRGRRGRTWHSPFGANLYLSLAWRFQELPAQFSSLGLVVGIALVEVLTSLGIREHGLKWPNDLQWRGRKLAGILIEHRGEGGGPARVVIGVGLNLGMTARQAGAIDQPWAALAEVCRAYNEAMPGRNAMCSKIVTGLIAALDEYAARGFTGFSRRWQQHDLTRDKPVNLEHGGRVIHGIARGIDGEGALLLEIDGRTQRFLSGDLSLRMAPVTA